MHRVTIVSPPAGTALSMAERLCDWLRCRGNVTQICSLLPTGAPADYNIFVTAPPPESVAAIKRAGSKVWLLCLWDTVSPEQRASYRNADVVLAPTHAAAGLLRDRWGINAAVLPWDVGLPPTKSRTKHSELFLPLFNPTSIEATALELLPRFLTVRGNWSVSVAYQSSRLAPFATRMLRRLQQQCPDRVMLHKAVPAKAQAALYQHAGLTCWPTVCDNAGLVPLTSLAMGTPVVAFAIPPAVEVLNKDNGVLVPCRSGANSFGVPFAVPRYEDFETRLFDLTANHLWLKDLQEAAADSLWQRSAAFDSILSRLLAAD